MALVFSIAAFIAIALGSSEIAVDHRLRRLLLHVRHYRHQSIRDRPVSQPLTLASQPGRRLPSPGPLAPIN